MQTSLSVKLHLHLTKICMNKRINYYFKITVLLSPKITEKLHVTIIKR